MPFTPTDTPTSQPHIFWPSAQELGEGYLDMLSEPEDWQDEIANTMGARVCWIDLETNPAGMVLGLGRIVGEPSEDGWVMVERFRYPPELIHVRGIIGAFDLCPHPDGSIAHLDGEWPEELVALAGADRAWFVPLHEPARRFDPARWSSEMQKDQAEPLLEAVPAGSSERSTA